MINSGALVVAAMAALVISGAVPSASRAQGTAESSMSGAGQYARDRSAADSLRRDILGFATFAGFASAPCAPGDVRTFERDSTGVVRAMLARLELLVLSHGAFTSLDSDEGRALMRTVVRLEGGGPGPRWDTMTGEGPRAFNPILPVELYDSEAKKCMLAPGDEPDGLVLPEVAGFVVPRDSGTADFAVAYGARGLNVVRDHFFTRHGADTAAVLRTTRVTAYAQWENFAVVAVRREAQRRGSVPIENAGSGAVYAFHRAGGEWRLLALVRSW